MILLSILTADCWKLQNYRTALWLVDIHCHFIVSTVTDSWWAGLLMPWSVMIVYPISYSYKLLILFDSSHLSKLSVMCICHVLLFITYLMLTVDGHLLYVHCHYVPYLWGGYRGGSPTAVRPSDPALCGSCPLVTPYYCRLGDLLCYFVYIVLCVHYCLCISVFSCFRCFLCIL